MTESLRRVLILGHTGFIGRALVRALAGRADLAWRGVSGNDGGDLTRPDALAAEPAAEVVVHAAGVVGVPASWAEPERFYRGNVLPTLAALEFARRHRARLVMLGTYLYGVPQYQPVDEAHPVACLNPYAASKRAAEGLCEDYARLFGMDVTVLRLFNPFGPGQPATHLIGSVIAQALGGDTITVNDLAPRRDFLWISDVAAALVAAIDRPLSGYRVFNLGFGASHSVAEVIERVTAVTGPRRVNDLKRPRPNEIPDCVCDNRAFRAAYGWAPAVTLAEGIARMLKTNGTETPDAR